jgi:hypothetical protein
MVSARVSTPLIPRRPFLFKKRSDGRPAAGFSQISFVIQPSAQTSILEVLPVNTIIADEREGEHQDLAK